MLSQYRKGSMKLLELSYKQPDWEIKNLQLQDLNLVVGKNSVGKSRTLGAIDLLHRMITQKGLFVYGIDCKIKYKKANNDIVEYEFTTESRSSLTKKSAVSYERIIINHEVVLKRDNSNTALIKSLLLNKWEEFNPPNDALVIHTRRDVKAYPYLEDIIHWGENAFGFRFGNLSNDRFYEEQGNDLLTSIEETSKLFETLNEKSKNKIIEEINSLGYSIENIEITKITRTYNLIVIKEKGVLDKISYYNLSQGMFRALSIIIFIEYLLQQQNPTTVIIDDLCEGLDYERATKLGKLVFDKCKNSNIQLIATSNDSFLMDVVDIEHWNVLHREGQVVTAMSYQTHKELFDKFRFTGLSNFDFFSSDFLKQQS